MKPHILRFYLRQAAELGVPIARLLDAVGLDECDLDELQHIDIWRYSSVLHHLAVIAPPGFGAKCGESLFCQELGLVGMAMLTSSTLRHSTEIWAKYGELAGFPLFGSVQFTEDSWVYTFGPLFPITDEAWRLCTETLTGCFRAETSQLTGCTFAYQRVALPFERGLRPGGDRSRFQATKVQFGCPQAVLVGAVAELATPNRFANPQENRLWLERCEAALREQHRSLTMREQVMRIFARSRDALPTVSEVAAQLRVSTRTLQRAMAAERQSYQKLASEFRIGLLRILENPAPLQPKRAMVDLRYKSINDVYRTLRKAAKA